MAQGKGEEGRKDEPPIPGETILNHPLPHEKRRVGVGALRLRQLRFCHHDHGRVFPCFFKHYWSYQSDINTSTAMLGFGNSLASLLVAFIASILVLFLLGLLLFYLAGKEEARSLTK